MNVCLEGKVRADLATLLHLLFYRNRKMRIMNRDFVNSHIYMDNTPNNGQIRNSHTLKSNAPINYSVLAFLNCPLLPLRLFPGL